MARMNVSPIKKRDRIVAFIVFSACLLMCIRLFYLQIISYDGYKEKVYDNVTRETPVKASRGTIYDRYGVVLAQDKTVERVYLSPMDIKNEDERVLVAKRLSEILNVGYLTVYQRAGQSKRKDVTIKKDVEKEEADEVRRFVIENSLKCVHTVSDTKRYYPHGKLLSHTLGFTGADGKGLYGIEYQYDKYLKGKDGKIVSAKNGLGMDMPYKYETFISAKSGNDIYLTIDYDLQCILERYLEQCLEDSDAKNRVTAVMMEPKTGKVLAMATKPDFNCNDPYTLDERSQKKLDESGLEVSSNEYRSYKSELLMTMWTNKAVNDLYEPGSTFKTVTCSTALEEGAVTQSTPYFCPGYHMVEGYGKIRCHKTTGHGALTFAEGLVKSCNPVMMITAAKLGEQTFYDYFTSFGYKEKTGIDLPGEALTYCHSFKNFHNTELAAYSFGQTFKTTPIRQLTSVCATANGGELLKPYVVEKAVDGDGHITFSNEKTIVRQVISPSTSSQIMDILEKGVTNGIGAVNAYVAGYKVAAKTGTSEKKDKLGQDGTYSLRIGSCVTVAPADDPQLALIVIVDEPNKALGRIEGSFVAAPYNSKIFSEALPHIGIEAQYSEKDEESKTVPVPSCLNYTVSEAVRLLKKSGLKAEVAGDGASVIAQLPKAGESVAAASGRVVLYTSQTNESNEVTVPELIGLTPNEANKKLLALGLNVRMEGNISGKVYSQYPKPNERALRGDVVKLSFASTSGDDE